MPAFEWVHVQLHQQKGMISLSPPTICNSAQFTKYEIQQISNLTSAYAVRLYEILIAWRSTGKTPLITMYDFRQK